MDKPAQNPTAQASPSAEQNPPPVTNGSTPPPAGNPTASPIQSSPVSQPKKGIPKALIFGVLAFLILAGAAFAFKDQVASLVIKPTPTPVPVALNPTPTPDPTAGWETYTSSFDSFTFKHPSTAEVTEDKIDSKAFRVSIQNGNFQIVITPNGVSGESSLDAYRKNVTSAGAEQFENTKISREDAIQYHIQAKGEDSIEIITIHNGKAYTFNASPLSPQNISLLDQILSTFKFTDSQTEDTTNWKTYTDKDYSFIMKYPDRVTIYSHKPPVNSRTSTHEKEISFGLEGTDAGFGLNIFKKSSSEDLTTWYKENILPKMPSDTTIKNETILGYKGITTSCDCQGSPSYYFERKGFIFEISGTYAKEEVLQSIKFTN